MRKSRRSGLAVAVLLVLVATSWQAGYTQEEEREYFPQTRHTVEGVFLEFYRAVPFPEVVYGYPITEAFISRDGLLVQYFQRARFEFHPGIGVSLTPIGKLLYRPGEPASSLDIPPGACRDFESVYSVCTVFLSFFENLGGVVQFGRPVSGVEKDGLRYVQYFEYARLEWYPESGDPRLEVRPGPLGRLYFDFLEEDPAYLHSRPVFNTLEYTALQVHAFPASPAVRTGGMATVFVVVQDPTYTPVSGAAVRLHVGLPDGRQVSFAGETNGSGFLRIPIPLDEQSWVGHLVLASVEVTGRGLQAATQTSFRVVP